MKMPDNFLKKHTLTIEESLEVLEGINRPDVMEEIRLEALGLRKKYYGTKVYTRGLIEFSNYCRNDCCYSHESADKS